MAIRLINSTISECIVGISVPKGADVTLEQRSAILNCGTGIQERENLLGSLGLRSDTPPAVVLSLLQGVSRGNVASRSELVSDLRGSSVAEWLTAGSNVSTVADGIFKLKESGLLDAAIDATVRFFSGS